MRKLTDNDRIKNQIRGRCNQNKEADNDCLKVNYNQSRSRLTRQAISRIWNNPDTLLLPEVCAYDIVQKNNTSSTTKLFNTQNETPPNI